jgi:hypothetical protein
VRPSRVRELRINDYEVDLVPSPGLMGSYSVPVSQGMSVDPSLAAPWRYCPQSHRQRSLPITMTVKPIAASQMEYGGS